MTLHTYRTSNNRIARVKVKHETTQEDASTFTICLLNPAYDPEMMQKQRERLLTAYKHLTPEQRANVIEELAELNDALEDCSDDRPSTQWKEFGYY